MKFVVSHCVLCKLWRNFRFFCSFNHHSGPLRKHMFTFTSSKGHGLWFVSSGFQSVLFVSCSSYKLGKFASQTFPIFLILVTCKNKAMSTFFLGQNIHSPLHAWYFFSIFFMNFLSFHITLHYNINSLITYSTCTDKHQTNYKLQIQTENIQHKTSY